MASSYQRKYQQAYYHRVLKKKPGFVEKSRLKCSNYYYKVIRQRSWKEYLEFRRAEYSKPLHTWVSNIKNPIKRAHILIERAIKRGRISRPTNCEACNKTPLRINSHHKDYTKWWEVIWLCTACHSKFHKEGL